MLKKSREHRKLLAELLQRFNWDETREGVNRESRSRIVILGLPRAGKSTLLNHLCGWVVSGRGAISGNGFEATQEAIEDFGLFCLATLPQDETYQHSKGFEPIPPFGYFNGVGYDPTAYADNLDSIFPTNPLEMAEAADLVVYILDGAAGLQAADYRWVGRLRRLGIPLLVVLNKCDLIATELADRQAEMERRLAATVLPISALEGTNLPDELLARIVSACPKLTVALGRALPAFRRKAARRLIQQTAVLNGIVALQPLPILDLPVQVMALTNLTFRLVALYEGPPSHARRREVAIAIAGSLAARYTAQQLAKIVPVAGWLISGAIGWSAAWAVGKTIMTYFEAGGDDRVGRGWSQTKSQFSRVYCAAHGRWQRRPRLCLTWGETETGNEEVSE